MNHSRFLLIAASALLVAAGVSCSDASYPTTPTPPAPVSGPAAPISPDLIGSTLNGLSSSLLRCKPQPYATDTLVVGPSGGTLVIGPHRLVIPAGALNQPVKIIGEAPVDTVVSVRFQPEGLKFNAGHPARLTLDYHACPLVQNLIPKHVAYTTESLSILNLLFSTDNLLQAEVSTDVQHFSRYAVAW